MAENETKGKQGGADEKPKEPENMAKSEAKNTAADLTGKPPAGDKPAAAKEGADLTPPEKDNAGLKITGITFHKGKRSHEIVAERNGMNYKTVQRYITLNKLTPGLMKLVDEGKVKFIPACELAEINPKHQQYVALAIEGNAPAPTVAQAKRMHELDGKNLLSPDVIDGIMLEENKKEERKVVLNSQEADWLHDL